jgi:nucleotide-binding universal stress UspA family protein
MIKNVMVAIDGSDCAEYARRYAVDLCLRLHAQLEAVLVVDTGRLEYPLFTLPTPGFNPSLAGALRNLRDLLAQQGRAALDEAARRSESEGLPIATSLHYGRPAAALAEIHTRSELVVLGRHGENASDASEPSGTVMDRFIRRARRPVLVVPRPAPLPESVLVGVDGSESAFRAIHVAVELANALSARLVIASVAESEQDAETATSRVVEAHSIARAHDCAAATWTAVGAPAPLLMEAAARTGSNLIVLGAHGHGWFYDRLLGSVAAQLAALSESPLLLVR